MSDCVGRIMMKRKKMSKGGMVSNGGDDEFDELADSRPDNFDDLSLRDDLDFSYDEANSGDELGNEQQDQDREDAVSRIRKDRMMKRNSNPRPA